MLAQFFRYNTIGIINTLFGFSIIFGLMLAGVSAVLSNAIGYLFGAILSYYLNARYTFSSKRSLVDAFKFLGVLGASYLVNYCVLVFSLQHIDPYISQVIAAISYTVTSFVLAKLLVFKENL